MQGEFEEEEEIEKPTMTIANITFEGEVLITFN